MSFFSFVCVKHTKVSWRGSKTSMDIVNACLSWIDLWRKDNYITCKIYKIWWNNTHQCIIFTVSNYDFFIFKFPSFIALYIFPPVRTISYMKNFIPHLTSLIGNMLMIIFALLLLKNCWDEEIGTSKPAFLSTSKSIWCLEVLFKVSGVKPP